MLFRKTLLAGLILSSLMSGLAQAATLYIDEFTSAPPTSVYYQAARFPDVAEQHIAIGASSTQSAAFSSVTGLIRVSVDAVCHVVIGGTNPTATATSATRMPAGSTEYFVVLPGDKLAVIME